MNREAVIPAEKVIERLAPHRRFRAYPNYRDSDVQWLGELPAPWEPRRLKTLLCRNDGGVWGDDFDPDGTVVLRSTEQTVGGKWQIHEPARRSLSATEKVEARLAAGDLLVTKSSGSELHIGKTTIVTLEIEALDCCFSNFMQRLRCKQSVYPWFVYYILNSAIGREQFVFGSNSTTGLANLNGGIIGNLWLGFPSLGKQREIAAFLDRETARIDELVTKKQRLIELLAEKRTALISHAVTKGLNPDAPMKDSGIDWLGQVPEHWQLKKVKYLSHILRGKFTHRPRNEPRMYDGPYPFIQTGDIVAAKKYIREYHQTLSEDGFRVSKQFPKGTLVMSIAANIGDMAILDFEACFPDSIVGFVPIGNAGLDFLYHLFTAMRQTFLSTATLNTQLNINIERIGSLPSVLPPPDEQSLIVEYLDRAAANSHQVEAKIRQAVDSLTEYRSALISAAVTGKIDVREVQK